MEKPLETRDPIELARANEKGYMQELWETVANGKKLFPQQDFFINVLLKQEILLRIVYRSIFAVAVDCPTPTFDQTVYKYSRKDDQLLLIWSLPNEEACVTYYNDAIYVVPEERNVLNDIIDFYNGTLMHKALQLNKETDDTPKIQLKIITNTDQT